MRGLVVCEAGYWLLVCFVLRWWVETFFMFYVFISHVCHVSSMGRVLAFRADGPGFQPRLA